MTEIRLHDTMAREKRVFTPADPKRVTMYVCGPTVYNRAHIGNARPAVVFDVLARLLRHVHGADSLVYARNVTDVDDKIIEAAEVEGVGYRRITERYYQYYLEDMGALGVRAPDFEPRATGFVPGMIDMIQRLIEKGNAYEAHGHVLFHVPSDPQYGLLSRRDPEAIRSGARVEVAPYKRDPSDFVLWKPAGESAEQVALSFDSPWGKGRPGWHIECSAMIEALGTTRGIGPTIDIHGGGLDLIFPHHENEIAQSRCAHEGTPLARYWVHNGFLSMAGSEKMSKSLGNVVTVGELLEQGHKGEVLRLALLSAHYRQPLEWSEALIAQSKATLDRWYRAKAVVEKLAPNSKVDPEYGIEAALADDLNTPFAISLIAMGLGDLLGHFGAAQALAAYDARGLIAAANLLGFLEQPSELWFKGERDPRIDSLVADRTEAKQRRDFAEADRIRAALAEEGILLEDGSQGTTWRRA